VVKIVPKPAAQIEPFDTILIRVQNAPIDQPIADNFCYYAGRDVD